MACGETINFYISSVGRNRFLQVPTGVFGGDLTWGIGTYEAADLRYRLSDNYASTVTADDGASQRTPVAAWYAMGTATVRDVVLSTFVRRSTPSGTVVQLQWNISEAVFASARSPDQCVTVVDGGVLVHCVTLAGSTAAVVRLEWPRTTPPSAAIVPGAVLDWMLRPRQPDAVLTGPAVVVDDSTVLVQVPSRGFAPPQARLSSAVLDNTDRSCSRTAACPRRAGRSCTSAAAAAYPPNPAVYRARQWRASACSP